ncbi:copper amine oxidase N-terminal domain-containing protein [Paenibacillus sp. FSL H8-0283]|uniref:copper amine oxidase N-terminal domain-containing protein n=1 Tax=Paenibacillus sp. FSL H8-0283 TaxID=2921383 RepID=UPI003255A91B
MSIVQLQSKETLVLRIPYTNGVKIAKTEGQPVERTETIYVPVVPIVKGMGDKLTWIDKPYSALITKKDGTKINIYVTRSTATVNGKSVPISKKVIETLAVPVQLKPAQISGKLYVPAEFLKEVMGYTVTTEKEGGTEFVVAGKAPTGGLEPNKETPTPSETWKPDLGYLPPSGWTPDRIKSTSTDNFEKDKKFLEEELGFKGGYSYNPFGKNATAGTSLIIDTHSKYYVTVNIQSWYGDKTKANDSNKTPYVARELFKFYFPNEYKKLVTIINDGVNGKDVSKYVGKPFTLDGRIVNIIDSEFGIAIQIGYKN